MSVAFRRESDEEHKEPRFELPLPPGPNLVTARGLAQAEAKVANLEGQLAEVPEGISQEEAALQKAHLQRQLRYWHTRLATAIVAPVPPKNSVAFGSHVRIRINAAERLIDIVGDDEAEPAAGRIAFSAPLARALIGAEQGEFVDFAGKAEAIEILDIGPISD